MTEIARLTHVSQPTVSRVLNGSQTVDPEIRERVLACAKEHDYQFNALAKGLQGSNQHKAAHNQGWKLRYQPRLYIVHNHWNQKSNTQDH